jgi:hypothetical protein
MQKCGKALVQSLPQTAKDLQKPSVAYQANLG